MISQRVGQLLARRALQQTGQQIRNSHGSSPYTYNIRGSNLPFSIEKPRLLFVKILIFCAIPYWIPFAVIRHQLKKQSGQYN